MPRPLSILLDLILVAVFIAIGNLVFGGASDFDSHARIGAPFAAAILITVIFMTLWRVETDSLRGGVIVWAATFGLGMIFRILIGDGLDLWFTLMAAGVLALLLIGWRALLLLGRRPGGSGKTQQPGRKRSDPRRSGNPAKRNP